MNTISNTGKWSEISALLNNNFNLIAAKLEQLDGAAWKHKGFFNTASDLESTYPSSPDGSYAYVGATAPYTLYTMQSGVWSATSQKVTLEEALDSIFDWSNIPSASETTRGLMTSLHVVALNNLRELATTASGKVAELQTTVTQHNAQIASLQTTVEGHTDVLDSIFSYVDSALDVSKITAPYFDKFESTYPSKINEQSALNGYIIVFLEKMGRFAAYRNSEYYYSWSATGEYSSVDSYGPAGTAIINRTYRKGHSLYVWNGNKMVEVGGGAPIGITQDEMRAKQADGTWETFLAENPTVYVYEE